MNGPHTLISRGSPPAAGALTAAELSALIDDRPQDGAFRVHRTVFSDPRVFDLEMKHIFESGWVFLGLASQLPRPHDYLTTTVGRQPVVVMRDSEGRLNAFLNSCRHKGAIICPLTSGNRKLHVCSYHGWSYDSAGRNRAIKGRAEGAYGQAFETESHDLASLPRFGEYRGLLFGSLSADVPSLEDYLGDARKLIDLAVDQSNEGLELVPGYVTFTFNGNWKLQLENCSDAYHFTSTHPSYLRVLDRRAASQGSGGAIRSVWDNDRPFESGARGATNGTFSFANGHVLNWSISQPSDAHPLFERIEELTRRFGEARCNWMFGTRNLTLFPNVQLAENASSQLRIIRPLAPDKTEMLTYCMAPIGESAEARRRRIRQYEDFFNPSGMATPDDAVLYEDCQAGHQTPIAEWLQGYSRGAGAASAAPNPLTEGLGIAPQSSVLGGPDLCDESVFHTYYRSWRDRLTRGIERSGTGAAQ
ncbi:MAG: SRPBCC family protein [Hyphomonadaceae bacterium]|nr:SRPBCC family protein [Hyphomonadaceae bacterium]